MKKGGQSMQGSQTRNIYAGRRVQAPAGSYRRPSAAQTARGKREKQRSRLERRRMLQVTVSAAILVIVVVVKLAMPDVLNRCRTQLLALMGEDTDFVAAFSAVGRAVSGDGSVGSALNDAYTAVFGPSHADDPAEEPANDPAQTGAVGRNARAEWKAGSTGTACEARAVVRKATEQELGLTGTNGQNGIPVVGTQGTAPQTEWLQALQPLTVTLELTDSTMQNTRSTMT